MRVLVSGASGFVGQALTKTLSDRGYSVVSVGRSRAGSRSADDHVCWDPSAGTIDKDRLGTVDAAIHLAGENVAGGRWTPARKRAIRDSRVLGTELLARTLAELPVRPKVLISASAIGIYGSRGDETLVETCGIGSDFLATVGAEWEAAARPAEQAGIRVVFPRIGVVLDPAGGALAKMLPVFRWGLGGKLGSGRQWMSWITRHDLVRLLVDSLEQSSWHGPVNAVAPEPVTNADFTSALARVLSRPAVFPVPTFMLDLVFGEMARATLLASQRVIPAKLQDWGWQFDHPAMDVALRAVLGR